MVNNHSLHLRVAQHPRRRSFCHRMASQKDLAARLSEVRPISTFHMKQLEYIGNVQKVFLRSKENFHERYSLRRAPVLSFAHYFQAYYTQATRDIPKWRWFIDRNNTQNWHEHQMKNLAFSNFSNIFLRHLMHKSSTISSSLLCH